MKRITAFATLFLMCLTLVGCSGKAERYTNYIKATLECTYYGNELAYAEAINSTNDDALNIYRDEVEYAVDLICYRFAVEKSCLSEKTAEEYEFLAMDILSKAKFTVDPAVKSGDAYHVTVHCEPMDFWDIAFDEVEKFYAEEFGTKYEAASSQEELAQYEQEYADRVLEILKSYVDKIGYGAPVKKIVEVTTDEDGKAGITDQEWIEIDNLILGGTE